MTVVIPPELQFIEILADAAIIVNGAGEIVLANLQAESLFGYQRGELIGQPLQILVPEAARERHAGQVQDYFAEPRVRNMASGLNLSGRRRDGSEFPADIVLSPLVVGGNSFTVSMIRALDVNRL